MIATLEYVELLDETDKLIDYIIDSEIMENYLKTYHQLQEDEEAQRLIKAFNKSKENYEEVERFGRYHPDYQEIMKAVRSSKRQMDLHPSVVQFKRAERELQSFLDTISEILAHSVSEAIIVPKEHAGKLETGCSSGGCSAGKACSCQVS